MGCRTYKVASQKACFNPRINLDSTGVAAGAGRGYGGLTMKPLEMHDFEFVTKTTDDVSEHISVLFNMEECCYFYELNINTSGYKFILYRPNGEMVLKFKTQEELEDGLLKFLNNTPGKDILQCSKTKTFIS
jgi:hypothetical protein